MKAFSIASGIFFPALNYCFNSDPGEKVIIQITCYFYSVFQKSLSRGEKNLIQNQTIIENEFDHNN
jgi:hypothetical protein